MQASAPAPSLQDLIAQVRALRAAGFLGHGNATALIALLKTANRFDDRDCTRHSVLALEIFVRHVDVLIRTGRLSPTKGQPLIDEANRIIDALLAGTPPKQRCHSKHHEGHSKHDCQRKPAHHSKSDHSKSDDSKNGRHDR
jgi:hypothetical protein